MQFRLMISPLSYPFLFPIPSKQYLSIIILTNSFETPRQMKKKKKKRFHFCSAPFHSQVYFLIRPNYFIYSHSYPSSSLKLN